MDIVLPERFNGSTVTNFYQMSMDDIKMLEPYKVNFDFNTLGFIEPEGVVTLANMVDLISIEYPEIKISYKVPGDYVVCPRDYPAVDFLDDSLFFEKVMGEKLHPGSNERSTTNGLKKLKNRIFDKGYIDSTISWLKFNVSLKKKSFSFLDTALGEVFNNIIDHSGSPVGGYAFAQHYPRNNHISLCIADCGMGIANMMKSCYSHDHEGNVLDCDEKLINYATYNKVSTKTTPRNRGLGLENLVSIIDNNKGWMKILSNEGSFVYNGDTNASKRILRPLNGYYRGTLLLLRLRTDTLEEDLEEDLLW